MGRREIEVDIGRKENEREDSPWEFEHDIGRLVGSLCTYILFVTVVGTRRTLFLLLFDNSSIEN